MIGELGRALGVVEFFWVSFFEFLGAEDCISWIKKHLACLETNAGSVLCKKSCFFNAKKACKNSLKIEHFE